MLVIDAPNAAPQPPVVQLALFGLPPKPLAQAKPRRQIQPVVPVVDEVTRARRRQLLLRHRAAVKDILLRYEFENALQTFSLVVAAVLMGRDELAAIPVFGDDAKRDERLEAFAVDCEAVLLDAAAHFMRRNGHVFA